MHCRLLALLLLIQVGYVEPTPIERARDEAVAAGYAARIDTTDTDTMAYYHWPTRVIHLNRASSYWSDPETRQFMLHMNDELSTPSPHHIIRHEIGHAVLHAIVGDEAFDRFRYTHVNLPPDEVLKVGGYASGSSAEFWAEVYAGLLDGRAYGDEVMKVYRAMARQ